MAEVLRKFLCHTDAHQSRMSITFKCIFLGEDHLWFFFLQKDKIIFVAFIHIYRKYHISTYFLRTIIFPFPCKEKHHIFRKKMPSFQIIQERSYSSTIFFRKTIFSGHLKKVSYFHVLFWERSYFIFRLKNKTIFSGKRNIIFPDSTTRKIIFQCDFFGKTIFSEHLDKKIIVFRALNILSKYQCDFKGYNLQHWLIPMIKKWRESVDKGGAFNAFLSDLSKVFGWLPHQLFIAKIHAYSFDMKSLNLTYNFLTNRKPRVKVCGAYNSWQEILCGVQQRSILWLLLFNIFRCDLSYFLKRTGIASYVDTTTRYNANLT